MNLMTPQKNHLNPRFSDCGNASQLLTISVRAARRLPVSKSVSRVHLSAGRCFHGKVLSGSRLNLNLKRCEIFRGKVPPRQTQ